MVAAEGVSVTVAATRPEKLTFRVRRVPGVPIVAARIWLWGGLRLEEVPGQALVTGRMLAEGTRQRRWDEIAVAADIAAVDEKTADFDAKYVVVRNDISQAQAELAEFRTQRADITREINTVKDDMVQVKLDIANIGRPGGDD